MQRALLQIRAGCLITSAAGARRHSTAWRGGGGGCGLLPPPHSGFSGLVDGVRLIYAAARIYFYFRCCFVPGERVETACAGVKGLRGWVGERAGGRRVRRAGR